MLCRRGENNRRNLVGRSGRRGAQGAQAANVFKKKKETARIDSVGGKGIRKFTKKDG